MNLFNNIKDYFVCFFVGVICGGLFALYYTDKYSNVDIPAIQAETTTITGSPQTVENIHTENGSLLLTNVATGAGVSTTSIPIMTIPEANNWITKRHTIMAKVYYLWAHDGFYPGSGVDYQYRYNRFVCGGGIVFAQKYAGINAGAGIVF